MKAAEKRQKEQERRAEKKVQKVAFNPVLRFFPVEKNLHVFLARGVLLLSYMKNCKEFVANQGQ